MCIVNREYLWYNEYNGKGVFFLKNLPENKKVIIMSIKYQKLFAGEFSPTNCRWSRSRQNP